MKTKDRPTRHELAARIKEWNTNGELEKTFFNFGDLGPEGRSDSSEIPQICVGYETGVLIIAHKGNDRLMIPLGRPNVSIDTQAVEEDCVARGWTPPEYAADNDDFTNACQDLAVAYREELQQEIASTPVEQIENIEALNAVFEALESFDELREMHELGM